MSEAFGRDAGSAVSSLPGVHVLAAVPSVGRPSYAGGPARAPQAAATEGLYERHAGKILGYCLHQLGSREEAEDAVQTTFMNAFRALGRGVVPEAESAWLFKIAENVCLSRRRSSWRRGRVESPSDFDVIEEVVPGPSRQRDELIGIEDALASMPEQQRRAILLREWQGLSYREISDELALSQSAVETLIFRARRSLAQGLEQPDLLKRPRRKGVRRALRVIDLGTLVAAAKTLLAGGAAVNATAAAVAVTAAVTVAGVTTKIEGQSPKSAPTPALSAASAAAPGTSEAARMASTVSARHRDRAGRKVTATRARATAAASVVQGRTRPVVARPVGTAAPRAAPVAVAPVAPTEPATPTPTAEPASPPGAEPVAQAPIAVQPTPAPVAQPSHIEPAPVEPAVVDHDTSQVSPHAPLLEPAPEIPVAPAVVEAPHDGSSIAPVPEPVVAPIVAATLPVQPAPTPHHATG